MRYLPIEIDVTEEISLGSDCESGWEATPAIEFKTQATSNCSILADSDVATAGVGMCKGCISACHENIAKFPFQARHDAHCVKSWICQPWTQRTTQDRVFALWLPCCAVGLLPVSRNKVSTASHIDDHAGNKFSVLVVGGKELRPHVHAVKS